MSRRATTATAFEHVNGPEEHPNAGLLRALYADLSSIGDYVDEDVVLHPAERAIDGDTSTFRGPEAVRDREIDLVRATDGTLRMDVEQIVANNHFGAAIGQMRARVGNTRVEMPFCGLWRFRDGRIIEHWENAYDVRSFAVFLEGHRR